MGQAIREHLGASTDMQADKEPEFYCSARIKEVGGRRLYVRLGARRLSLCGFFPESQPTVLGLPGGKTGVARHEGRLFSDRQRTYPISGVEEREAESLKRRELALPGNISFDESGDSLNNGTNRSGLKVNQGECPKSLGCRAHGRRATSQALCAGS